MSLFNHFMTLKFSNCNYYLSLIKSFSIILNFNYSLFKNHYYCHSYSMSLIPIIYFNFLRILWDSEVIFHSEWIASRFNLILNFDNLTSFKLIWLNHDNEEILCSFQPTHRKYFFIWKYSDAIQAYPKMIFWYDFSQVKRNAQAMKEFARLWSDKWT
jgi:hypothetical protein